jgi:hypothetical protein
MDIDLKRLINLIEKNGVNIKIENRNFPGWFSYGFPKQHVEVLKYCNVVDKDRWDGLILGYQELSYDYNTKIRTKTVLGVILVEDGNHKIIFKIPYKRGFSKTLLKKEVNKFMYRYKKKWGLKVKYLNRNQLRQYLKSEKNKA